MLSNSLKKKYEYDLYGSYGTYSNHPQDKRAILTPRVKRYVKKKKNPVKLLAAAFVAVGILGLYGYYVCPYNYKHYFEPLFLNRFLNRNFKPDAKKYVNPTRYYINNSYFLNEPLLLKPVEKTKKFTNMQIVSEMTATKTKLEELFKKYPKLSPSVYVWEYSTSSGLEINADEVYPSASIIKIPIVFELIRLIDYSSKTKNPITLGDKRMFTETFRTSGSGNLQKTAANVNYTLDYLAGIAIANSDNSATNMILNEIGGMDGFNRSMRNLGLKITSMQHWLPDLEGTNKITAKEISTILYNIDNPNYINPKYKSILKEYLGNTRNIHLIKEKLPQGAIVLHKTGDIGTMLGDSGIVYTDNGKKYIVTIIVKRPHNDYSARTLIQDASLLIYNDIKELY